MENIQGKIFSNVGGALYQMGTDLVEVCPNTIHGENQNGIEYVSPAFYDNFYTNILYGMVRERWDAFTVGWFTHVKEKYNEMYRRMGMSLENYVRTRDDGQLSSLYDLDFNPEQYVLRLYFRDAIRTLECNVNEVVNSFAYLSMISYGRLLLDQGDWLSPAYWMSMATSLESDMNDIGTDPVTRDGRFSKRVSAYYWKKYGYRMSKEQITAIGNLYNQFSNTSKTFKLKITNNFNWSDGEFGKGDSCWWGCYGDSRATLWNSGGYAALFYDDSMNGIGRFWILPINDDLVIGFNPYGVQPKDAAACVARLMETITNKRWVYGKRDFRNVARNNSYYPYINGSNGRNNDDGSIVYAIYTEGNPPSNPIEVWIDRHTGVFEHENGAVCPHCNIIFDAHHIITALDGDGATIFQGCSECAHSVVDRYCRCAPCGRYFTEEQTHTHINGFRVCTRCYNSRLENYGPDSVQTCGICGCVTYDAWNSGYITIDGVNHCPQCY